MWSNGCPDGIGEGAEKKWITMKIWRGGRVAEGARLESVYTFTRIAGSNPALSAILRK